jgi:hypothetical protein
MKITKKRMNNKTTGLKSLFTGDNVTKYSGLIFFEDLKEIRMEIADILTTFGRSKLIVLCLI